MERGREEGRREGGREGGREGERERGREGGREGGKSKGEQCQSIHPPTVVAQAGKEEMAVGAAGAAEAGAILVMAMT